MDIPSCLRRVGAYNITDNCSTKWTLATTNSTPLLDGAIVAHAHVSTHIEHGVDGILVANGALGTRICALLITETILPFTAIQGARTLGNGLQNRNKNLLI